MPSSSSSSSCDCGCKHVELMKKNTSHSCLPTTFFHSLPHQVSRSSNSSSSSRRTDQKHDYKKNLQELGTGGHNEDYHESDNRLLDIIHMKRGESQLIQSKSKPDRRKKCLSNRHSYANNCNIDMEYYSNNVIMPGRHSLDVIRESPKSFAVSLDSPPALFNHKGGRSSSFDCKELTCIKEAFPRLSLDSSTDHMPRSVLDLRKTIQEVDQLPKNDYSSLINTTVLDTKKCSSSKPAKPLKISTILARLIGLNVLPLIDVSKPATGKSSSTTKRGKKKSSVEEKVVQIKSADQADSHHRYDDNDDDYGDFPRRLTNRKINQALPRFVEVKSSNTYSKASSVEPKLVQIKPADQAEYNHQHYNDNDNADYPRRSKNCQLNHDLSRFVEIESSNSYSKPSSVEAKLVQIKPANQVENNHRHYNDNNDDDDDDDDYPRRSTNSQINPAISRFVEVKSSDSDPKSSSIEAKIVQLKPADQVEYNHNHHYYDDDDAAATDDDDDSYPRRSTNIQINQALSRFLEVKSSNFYSKSSSDHYVIRSQKHSKETIPINSRSQEMRKHSNLAKERVHSLVESDNKINTTNPFYNHGIEKTMQIKPVGQVHNHHYDDDDCYPRKSTNSRINQALSRFPEVKISNSCSKSSSYYVIRTQKHNMKTIPITSPRSQEMKKLSNLTKERIHSLVDRNKKINTANPFHNHQVENRLRQLGIQYSSKSENLTLEWIIRAMHLKGLLRQTTNSHANSNTKPKYGTTRSSFCFNHPNNINDIQTEASIIILKPSLSLSRVDSSREVDEKTPAKLSNSCSKATATLQYNAIMSGLRCEIPTASKEELHSLRSVYRYELKSEKSMAIKQQYQSLIGAFAEPSISVLTKINGSSPKQSRRILQSKSTENLLPVDLNKRLSRSRSTDKEDRVDYLVNNSDEEEEVNAHGQCRRKVRNSFSDLQLPVQTKLKWLRENKDFKENDHTPLKVFSQRLSQDHTRKFRLSKPKRSTEASWMYTTMHEEESDKKTSAKKINLDQESMLELGQRSPVSVLDAQMVEEACSPDAIELCQGGPQGEVKGAMGPIQLVEMDEKLAREELVTRRRRIRDERRMWNDNIDFKYVKDILEGAGLLLMDANDDDSDEEATLTEQCVDDVERWQVFGHSISPDLYSTLEKTWERDDELESHGRANDVDFGRELYAKSRQEALWRYLVFNCVEELLSKRLLFMQSMPKYSSTLLKPPQVAKMLTPSNPSSSSHLLLMEVWRDLQAIHPTKMCKHDDDMIQIILEKELLMQHWWLDPWNLDIANIQFLQMPENVEALIFSDLLEDLSTQLLGCL